MSSARLNYASFELASPAPLSLSKGWNLIGINGMDKEYTAESFLDTVNEHKGFTVDNISRWRTDASRYDGVQKDKKEDGTYSTFGFDFPLTNRDGYFLRVTEGNGVFDWD